MLNPLSFGSTATNIFQYASLPMENPFFRVLNDIATRKEVLPMKQVLQADLPDAQQILKIAYESGVLLSSFPLLNGCFTTLLCFKPNGMKAGTKLKLPDSWWRFAKESNRSPNVVSSTVVCDLLCGAELIFGKMPSTSISSTQDTNKPTDAAEQAKNFPAGTDKEDGYSCERCGKMFSYEYYRDKHLKYTRCVDNGNRKYPCTICNRSFEKRDRLRIHILHVHENHRPHICTVCSKSFSQSSSLNKHLRVHSGERPYKCEFCPKAFTASSILRTHIRQHSGEKPFKCSHCGKAFASHAAHDSHVRRSHVARAP